MVVIFNQDFLFFLLSLFFLHTFLFFSFFLFFSPPHLSLISIFSSTFSGAPFLSFLFFSSLAAAGALFFSSNTSAGTLGALFFFSFLLQQHFGWSSLSHMKIGCLSFSHHRISSSPPRLRWVSFASFFFCSNLISFKIVI